MSGGTIGNVNEQQEETVANENTSNNNANKKVSSSSPADTPGEKPEEALESARKECSGLVIIITSVSLL